jgi:hypothetical protein
VVKAIVETEQGKQGLKRLGKASPEEIAKLFKAREVRLGPAGERDLIVRGSGAMTGADNEWFWLVRVVGGHPLVVLWTGGNSVSILTRRTNGLPDIETDWTSAAGYSLTWIYRYEGDQYKLVSKRTTYDRHQGK